MAEEKNGCETTRTNQRFDGLGLMTGDVVGWGGQDTNVRPLAACEVKLYPYPVGSAGYGAIGQALALRPCAETVYVCGVAARSVPPARTWQETSGTSTMRELLQHCKIAHPGTFDAYVIAAQGVFEHFYRDLGLGFLLVHDNDGPPNVRVLVEPRASDPDVAGTTFGRCNTAGPR